MSRQFHLILVVLLTIHLHEKAVCWNRNKLLVWSLNGFRADYLDLYGHLLPNLTRHFVHEGCAFAFVNPTFPTKTLPCHHSIVTGRYQEGHGMVGQRMWDPALGLEFRVGLTYEASPFWNESLPIWATAVAHGLHVGSYFWPGDTALASNAFTSSGAPLRPTAFFKYDPVGHPIETRLARALDWLDSKQDNYDFVLLFYEQPDETAHRVGPHGAGDEGRDLERVLEKIDELVGGLMEGLVSRGLNDSVNVVLTSAHGMADVTRAIFFEEFVNVNRWDVRLVEHGALLSFFVSNQSTRDELVANLTRMTNETASGHVFQREQLPDRFHYRNHRRIPDVLVLANEGVLFLPESERGQKSSRRQRGDHGYDAELVSMRAFGAVHGPSVRACRGAREPPVEQVDLYVLLAELLGVRPEPGYEGDPRRVEGVLRSQFSETESGNRDFQNREDTTELRDAASNGNDGPSEPNDADGDSAGGLSLTQPKFRSGGPRITAIDQSALLIAQPEVEISSASRFAHAFNIALFSFNLLCVVLFTLV